ncbi:MAG: hypothetical protein BroJett011_71490 [Chloroflexota bacterium]|nr:MAG: hypothetical protein BroJett011_71490 [Chloroflexota bacterium]
MKRLYQKLGLAFILMLGLVFGPGVVAAQEAIQVVDQSVDANFRDHITFTLNAKSTTEIIEVDLLYQVVGQLASSRNGAEFTPGTSINAEFKIDQTKPENYMPPGTELNYWWKIVDADGNELRTEKQRYLYLDNRYEWQTLENERLTLYWYEGDDSFGQALFNRANVALDTLASDVGISLKDPIKIFIYASHQDLLRALSSNAQEWTGGQAMTTFGVVVIGVPPSQLDWGLRATTHEMSHLVIHQATDNPFRGLPRWLDEGIAVYNEDTEKLIDDFAPIFDDAVQRNELMTLRTLSSPFPADPMLANLAYGQSGAVVKFIIETYGPEKMAKLLSIFAEGSLDDEALQEALGVDTDGLDNAFRASLDLPPLPGTAADAPAEVATEEAELASSAEMANPVENTPPTAQPEANQDSTLAELPPEPTPAPPAEPKNSPLGLPCLAGILPLLALGLVFARHKA